MTLIEQLALLIVGAVIAAPIIIYILSCIMLHHVRFIKKYRYLRNKNVCGCVSKYGVCESSLISPALAAQNHSVTTQISSPSPRRCTSVRENDAGI